MKRTKRSDEISMAAADFAHAHKHLLVIVADPVEDTLFAAYNDSQMFGTIRNTTGTKARVVKQMLYQSKLRGELSDFTGFKLLADMFLSSLAEFLWVRMHKVPEFFKWISDACWYLPKGRRTGDNPDAETP
jgi:hypothetical protein